MPVGAALGALDTDRVGWRRDHTERLIGGVAGHGADDLQIVHCRGDRHRRVTELAQDGEFQVAVAFALATTPLVARDRDRPADDGIQPQHIREGHLLRPAVAARQASVQIQSDNSIAFREAEAGRGAENGDGESSVGS